MSRTDNEISIEEDEEILALEKILAAAEAEENQNEPKAQKEASSSVATAEIKSSITPSTSTPRLKNDSSFAAAFGVVDNELPGTSVQVASVGNIAEHKQDDLDSSDDEDIQNFLERKYNEYGADINKRLKDERNAAHEAKVARDVSILSQQEDCSKPAALSIKTQHNQQPRVSRMNKSASSSFQQKAPVSSRLQPQELSKQIFSNVTAKSTNMTNTPVDTGYRDPTFGLHIVKPLVSQALIKERMADRRIVPISAVEFHVERGDLTKDWVIAGAIVNKSPVRKTKKDEPFSIWRLSDLRGDMKTISLFLFKKVHKELWKTAEGMCVAVLNPEPLQKRETNAGDGVCLTINTAQKLMILGRSKDFGVCRSRKRNGEPCSNIVNLSESEHCVFHLKQEFSKMSRRSELQSATAGRGLNELRNKVLGKSEVFYGGQSFTAVPAKKSTKQIAKDANRLSLLSEYAVSPFASSINHASKPKSAFTATPVPYAARDGHISKVAANVPVTSVQRLKDLERLKALNEQSKPVEEATTSSENSSAPTVSPSTSTPSCSSFPLLTSGSNVPEKFKNRHFSVSTLVPQLSRENFCLEVNVDMKRASLAKLKAAEILKKQPIAKQNPNSTRGSIEGKRRAIDELNDKFANQDPKRRKRDEDSQREEERKSRIQRIIDASSSHKNLIDMREQEEQDKYFNKLEKKEALEEKMLNTFKMPCKAVICKQCKYTAFSAADRCKEEKHPLKVVDAEKRFFQCKDCGNRTVSLFKLPKVSCTNCHSSRWERTAMIRERKVNVTAALSLRGDEEVFLGSVANAANLNLLVPNEGTT